VLCDAGSWTLTGLNSSGQPSQGVSTVRSRSFEVLSKLWSLACGHCKQVTRAGFRGDRGVSCDTEALDARELFNHHALKGARPAAVSFSSIPAQTSDSCNFLPCMLAVIRLGVTTSPSTTVAATASSTAAATSASADTKPAAASETSAGSSPSRTFQLIASSLLLLCFVALGMLTWRRRRLKRRAERREAAGLAPELPESQTQFQHPIYYSPLQQPQPPPQPQPQPQAQIYYTPMQSPQNQQPVYIVPQEPYPSTHPHHSQPTAQASQSWTAQQPYPVMAPPIAHSVHGHAMTSALVPPGHAHTYNPGALTQVYRVLYAQQLGILQPGTVATGQMSAQVPVIRQGLADAANIASFEVHESKANDPCPICLGPLSEEKVSIGPCLHTMHTSCLQSWLAKDTTCPVCRASFVENEAGEIPSTTLQASMASHAAAGPSRAPNVNEYPNVNNLHSPAGLGGVQQQQRQ
jgi:Ring finger domain